MTHAIHDRTNSTTRIAAHLALQITELHAMHSEMNYLTS